MTSDEMRAVVRAVEGVDGGCPYCAGHVFGRIHSRFPEHESVLAEEWFRQFEESEATPWAANG